MNKVTDNNELLEQLTSIAQRAGERIIEIYAQDFEVSNKSDNSPVTRADAEAEAIILQGLATLDPGTPVISEEQAELGAVPEVGRRFWLVDPLDGTREFINRNGEFTVNIALIVDGAPQLGVVLAPALGRLFAGAAGYGAWVQESGQRRPLHTRAVPAQGLGVVSSRSHGDNDALERFLAGRTVAQQLSAGSSLKLCLVAGGEADVYPRLGRTMEWDIAAGDAVLRAAGGVTLTLDGAPLQYGKPTLDNPHFAAWGRAPEPV